ncbi:MAG TPA: hypothetical protein VIX86_24915 [Streptosporangiaceae bacterium]
MDEQEHPAGAEPAGSQEGGAAAEPDGATAPLALPAAAGPRPGRGPAARRALASRSAGWMVAALLAGVIIGLSIGFAGSSSTVVMAPAGVARSFTIGPAGGPQRAIVVGPCAGVQRTIFVGPGKGGPQRTIVVGPGGLPPGAVVVGPGAGVQRTITVGPGGAVQRTITVVGPAGGKPVKVSRQSVKGRTITLPPGVQVQVPANASFPPGMPVQVRPGMVSACLPGPQSTWTIP